MIIDPSPLGVLKENVRTEDDEKKDQTCQPSFVNRMSDLNHTLNLGIENVDDGTSEYHIVTPENELNFENDRLRKSKFSPIPRSSNITRERESRVKSKETSHNTRNDIEQNYVMITHLPP